ncbi:MAG: hypothetical protein EBR30_07850 [Cytophagia bacterium]|nr:hypothetical protein [Cytophagia bacterium]
MSFRLTSFVGILTGVFFIIGFAILFVLNPQTYEELNNLSLASYNILGMHARLWAAVVYGITGLLNIIFCVGLLKDKSNSSAGLIGKILLIVSGVTWLSFGLMDYNPTTDIADHILLIRLIVIITASFVGLLLLGIEYDRIVRDKFLKWFTLSSAGLISLISILSIFVYNDDTWIRTNVSLTTYFVWFTVFGLRTLRKEST